MNKKILIGLTVLIFLMLLLEGFAVITPNVWNILTSEGTTGIEIGVKFLGGASRRGIPGPQEISGIGYEVEVARDSSTGALTPGQKTFQTYKVKKLTRPFVDLATVSGNRNSALENDGHIWNWARQVYDGNVSISSIRKSMDIIHYKEGGGGTPSSSVRYNLTRAWSNSWQLDPIRQGQTQPMTETYTFVYEGIEVE